MTAKKVPFAGEMPGTNGVSVTTAKENSTPEKDVLRDLPKNAENVQVITNLKYNVSKPPEQPKRQQANSFPLGFQSPQYANNDISENPLLDFFDSLDSEDNLYIMLTRLPDTVTGVKFNRPCMSAEIFPLIPLNRASFLKDVQTVNGESGGRFKGVVCDENMNDLGLERLPAITIPNPYKSTTENINNNQNNQESVFIQFMKESEARMIKLIETVTEKKEDKFADFAQTFLMAKMKDIDKPRETVSGLAGLPQEQQTMLAILGNPGMTSAVTKKISESISGMFSSEEKTASAVKNGMSWVEKIIDGVASSPETQQQLLMFGEKLINAAGFFAAKYAESKNQNNNRPPRYNPNQPPPPVQPNPIYTPPPVVQENAIDVDAEPTAEQLATEQAIIDSPMFQSILKYIDSEETLSTENEFMVAVKEGNPVQFGTSIAMLKYSTFNTALDTILNEMPFIEDFLNGRMSDENLEWDEKIGERRKIRLQEYHELLKTYAV